MEPSKTKLNLTFEQSNRRSLLSISLNLLVKSRPLFQTYSSCTTELSNSTFSPINVHPLSKEKKQSNDAYCQPTIFILQMIPSNKSRQNRIKPMMYLAYKHANNITMQPDPSVRILMDPNNQKANNSQKDEVFFLSSKSEKFLHNFK